MPAKNYNDVFNDPYVFDNEYDYGILHDVKIYNKNVKENCVKLFQELKAGDIFKLYSEICIKYSFNSLIKISMDGRLIKEMLPRYMLVLLINKVEND